MVGMDIPEKSYRSVAVALAQNFGAGPEPTEGELLPYAHLCRDLLRYASPHEELRQRLNDRVNGRDPGAPLYWKGL